MGFSDSCSDIFSKVHDITNCTGVFPGTVFGICQNNDEISKTLEVSNILKPDPYITVDVDTSQVLVDDDGTVYRYGNVVIKLVDDNFTLTDIYTGKAPTFTFTPEGVTSYVFSKSEIVASLGDEEPIGIPAHCWTVRHPTS